jgi:hypothetical protein
LLAGCYGFFDGDDGVALIGAEASYAEFALGELLSND